MSVDLRQSANVMWFAHVPKPGAVEGGEKRHFSDLEDAIRFVMEGIRADMRGTAWITTDSGSLSYEDIEKLYQDLDS
jgi:hypothetical protein